MVGRSRMGAAQPSALVDVVAAAEHDGRDEAGLKHTRLQRLLRHLEHDVVWDACNAREHAGGLRLHLVQLFDQISVSATDGHGGCGTYADEAFHGCPAVLDAAEVHDAAAIKGNGSDMRYWLLDK